jgi:glycosyltransferase involved in cell wall biosynthesis
LRILLLTRYGRLGASSRLRAYQYLPYLQAQGLDVTTVPLLGDYYQQDLYSGHSRQWTRILNAYALRLLYLARAARFDLLWIEYELFPWLPALAERFLARRRIPYVVDYDDPIFHRYELHPNGLVRALLGRKIDVIMRRASIVVVGNAYLADRARFAGAKRVELVPTVVDLERYRADPGSDGRAFTIGWIGSPSTAKYLGQLAPVLASFCRAHDARIVVVGPRATNLDHLQVEVKPWSEATEVEDIYGFDVGIMPLPDDPWERGKCGYKLIQYMACSRPVIASPVGANREIVEHGVNGFLATTDDEWRSALDMLYAAPELRARLGAAGRRKVETAYCTRVTAPRLANLLRVAASNQ